LLIAIDGPSLRSRQSEKRAAERPFPTDSEPGYSVKPVTAGLIALRAGLVKEARESPPDSFAGFED